MAKPVNIIIHADGSMPTKICKHCQIEKTVDQFRFRESTGKGYYESCCIPCEKELNSLRWVNYKKRTKIYTIYCSTAPNGMKYVGCTAKTLIQRKARHYINSKTDYKMKYLDAIREFGIENMVYETLETTTDYIEAQALEIYWIRELNSQENGYNVCYGGIGWWGMKMTDEAKEKLRQFNKNDENCKEHLRKIHEGLKGKKRSQLSIDGTRKGNLGRKHTPEAKQRMSDARKKAWTERPEMYLKKNKKNERKTI